MISFKEYISEAIHHKIAPTPNHALAKQQADRINGKVVMTAGQRYYAVAMDHPSPAAKENPNYHQEVSKLQAEHDSLENKRGGVVNKRRADLKQLIQNVPKHI